MGTYKRNIRYNRSNIDMTVTELIKNLKELELLSGDSRVVINGNDVVMAQVIGNDEGEEVVELVY